MFFKRPSFCLLAGAAALGLLAAGCTSDDSTNTADRRGGAATTGGPHKKHHDDDDHDMESPPHVGMTKAQVIAKYGEPKGREVTDEGEQWLYRLNLADAMVGGLIPFNYGGTRLRMGTINFGSGGRVQSYHWDTKTHDDD